MEKILFLKGKFVEKIWGGKRLKKEFPYKFESENIGEYWAISAMKEFPSEILNGKYKGEKIEKENYLPSHNVTIEEAKKTIDDWQ